ncbi:MAG TPA: phosphoribosylglycinamide formyltransferase [Gammaproteobacteria bacterium]|nr:phosphoribosylglycinamide formyltransferase [Gammaproteobacteria bacterium]
MPAHTAHSNLPIVVLASGEGTNLQAILDSCANGTLPVTVKTVISDRPQARALMRARSAGVASGICLPAGYADREQYDAMLIKLIDRYKPGLVVLAGFMRILSDSFVHQFHGLLLNIHPSLLPKYRGLHTHRRVLEAGEQEHGCSVHFVTQTLDGGPVIAQVKVRVQPGDTEASLRIRVQRQEHRLYPEVIGWFARGRLRLDDKDVILDGQSLHSPVMLPAQEY